MAPPTPVNVSKHPCPPSGADRHPWLLTANPPQVRDRMIASYKKHAGPTDQEIDGFKSLAVRDYYRYLNKVEVFNGIRQALKNSFKAIRAGRVPDQGTALPEENKVLVDENIYYNYDQIRAKRYREDPAYAKKILDRVWPHRIGPRASPAVATTAAASTSEASTDVARTVIVLSP